MSDDKEKGKEVFIVYLDENGETFKGFVNLLDSDNPAFIRIQTPKNIFSIPIVRVIKIKEKLEANNETS